MTTRIYCKNRHFVLRDPVAKAEAARSDEVEFLGRTVTVQRGHATPGGVLLPASAAGATVTTSRSCHELDVVAADPATGVKPGDRVIVYLGGDTDGTADANGISAFVPVEGTEHVVVHEAFVWAKVTPGGVEPLRRIVLTARNDAAFMRHVFGQGAAAVMVAPEAQLVHGARATGEESDREIAAVTALYETVRRVGPDAARYGVSEGEVLCFSPSFSSTRLDIDGRQFHLVDAKEAFFSVEG